MGSLSTGGLPTFDPTVLHAELERIPAEAWSLPSTFAETGVHHGYRRVVLVESGYRREAWFGFVLDQFAPVFSAWLSWIDAGGFIRPHCDAGPYRQRWQIPVRTAGTFDGRRATDGVPFVVEHWQRHRVDNPTDRPRVHLVVDRDLIANPETGSFHLFEED